MNPKNYTRWARGEPLMICPKDYGCRTCHEGQIGRKDGSACRECQDTYLTPIPDPEMLSGLVALIIAREVPDWINY